MAGSKPTRIPNVWDRLRDQQNQTNAMDARNRRVFNPHTVAIPPNPEIPPAGTKNTENALLTAGGTMIGAIAYFPKIVSISEQQLGKPASALSNTLDISKGIGADSSRIIMAGLNGSVGEFDLEFIKGGQYAGQYLNIQGIVGNRITIQNDASGFGNEGFNIRTQTGEVVFLEDNANMELIFDSTQNQWALITGGIGEAGAESIYRLSADQLVAGQVEFDLEFPFGDPNRIKPFGPSGVVELVDGIFLLEGVLGVQMIGAGAGSEAIAEWQSSPDGTTNWTNITNNSTVVATYSTGRPEFTVQPHAIVFADATGISLFVRLFFTEITQGLTGNGILSEPSFAKIEFTNPIGGGGSGGGGATSLSQLTDTNISPNPPIANDILQFNTATNLWENQPASAGGGLLPDLSNLQAGTIPPVDMSLNLHSLLDVGNLLFTASGSGFIDNVQTLSFFQNLHNIQSFGDRMDYQVDAPDSHLFRNGGVETVEIRTHGISALDYRFLAEQNVTQNVHQIVRNTDGDMNFNVPDLEIFSWSINAVTAFTMTDQTLRGDFFMSDLGLITLPQGNAFPPDGWIQNNNNDVIIGSGGNAVNITDVFNNLNSGQFADNTFAIFNETDPSKIAVFSSSGIAPGFTRTFTFQNASGTIAMLNGAQQDFSVNVSFGSNQLLDVGGVFTTSSPSDIGQNSNYFSDLYINQIFFFGDPALGYKIGGDTIDGFDFIVPDTNREFDFFFDGGVTPSWIIRPTVIDAQGGRLEDLEEIQFDGNSIIPIPSAVKRIGYDGGDFQINMPTGNRFNLLFNGTPEWNFTATSMNGDNIILNQSLIFNNSGTNPLLNGEMTRNGVDILVFTSEGVKNMKDIGSGGGGVTNEISQGNSSVIVTDTGTGAVNITVDASTIMAFSSSLGIIAQKQLQMNANNITTIGDMTMANSASNLQMSGGDILGVDDLTFNGSGSILNMLGGDILNVDDLAVLDKITCSEIEINGDLNHDGSRLGFYGTFPITKGTVNLQGTALFQVVATLSDLLDQLRDYGLINTNV